MIRNDHALQMGSAFVSLQALEAHGVLGWSVTMFDSKMESFANRRRAKKKKIDVSCVVCVSTLACARPAVSP